MYATNQKFGYVNCFNIFLKDDSPRLFYLTKNTGETVILLNIITI